MRALGPNFNNSKIYKAFTKIFIPSAVFENCEFVVSKYDINRRSLNMSNIGNLRDFWFNLMCVNLLHISHIFVCTLKLFI